MISQLERYNFTQCFQRFELETQPYHRFATLPDERLDQGQVRLA